MHRLINEEWFPAAIVSIIVGILLVKTWQFCCRIHLIADPPIIDQSLLENWPDPLEASGSVDLGRLSYLRRNKIERVRSIGHLRVPNARSFFIAGSRVSNGLSLSDAVMAKFDDGIGSHSAGVTYKILQSGLKFEIAGIVATMLFITLTSIALFAALIAFCMGIGTIGPSK